MMGRYCEEGDDGGAMPFMCSRWRKRRRQLIWGKVNMLDVLFIEFRVLWCSRKEGG